MTAIAALLLSAACQVPIQELEVINWNTYHLFDHQAKLGEAVEWLAEEAPDILALQEVLHTDEAGLQELATSWGHGYAVMHKEHGYPVALTSTAPIEVIDRRVSGFHHGYLHARTHGIEVFVVHFWPTKVGEAEAVAEVAASLAAEGLEVLVVGDFNGKIRSDEAYLLENGFAEERDGEPHLDYRLTDAFLKRGFAELVTEHSPGDLYTFGAPALIPRWASNMQQVRERRRRIDFLFASPNLKERCMRARVNTDDERVGQHSDHYPLLCSFTSEE